MSECWASEEDVEFSVSMTPESSEDCEKTFDNLEEFFKWYNND